MPESHAISSVTEDREGQGLGHNSRHTEAVKRHARIPRQMHVYTHKASIRGRSREWKFQGYRKKMEVCWIDAEGK